MQLISPFHFFLNNCLDQFVLKGVRMVARALLRSEHYDLCPVDSCVNLHSALDSRNWVMSMRTSSHLRALLTNNNPCGQQFS